MDLPRFRIIFTTTMVLLICRAAWADGQTWVSIAPVYRGDMQVTISGRSATQASGAHAAEFPAGVPSAVGPVDAYADRSYDDGYVNKDAGTGNPDSIDPAVTWFWGYDNGDQYDGEAGTLAFHRTGYDGYRADMNDPLDVEDDYHGAGVEIVLGLPVVSESIFSDFCLGLQFIRSSGAGFSGTTYRESILRTDVIDTYDVAGLAMPGAGHAGTYDGPFDDPPVIPSPVIPNIPASRATPEDLLSEAFNSVNMSVDADLYQFWFGPRIALHASDALAFYVIPKLSISAVDIEVQHRESFVSSSGETIDSWEESTSERPTSCGAGIDVGINLTFDNGFFAGLKAAYEWNEKQEIDAGTSSVKVDPSGYTVALVVGKGF